MLPGSARPGPALLQQPLLYHQCHGSTTSITMIIITTIIAVIVIAILALFTIIADNSQALRPRLWMQEAPHLRVRRSI